MQKLIINTSDCFTKTELYWNSKSYFNQHLLVLPLFSHMTSYFHWLTNLEQPYIIQKRGESAALGRHYNTLWHFIRKKKKGKKTSQHGDRRCKRVKNRRRKQVQACCSRLLTPLTLNAAKSDTSERLGPRRPAGAAEGRMRCRVPGLF